MTVSTTQLTAFLNSVANNPSALSGSRRNLSVGVDMGTNVNSSASLWNGDVKLIAIWGNYFC